MVKQFLNHIQHHQLCKTTDKILLAISGGVDSMVMAHLFLQAGYRIGVAHVNYQLRGEESNRDLDFVEAFCRQHDLDLQTTTVDTAEIAQTLKQSIQVTARNIRYDFFRQLIRDKGYHCVATAHTLSDNLETILLNITRGTGITGLTGIPVCTGVVIRPLLFASRDEITRYAVENKVAWVEDSSNDSDDYARNIIRHHVIAHMRTINTGLEETFKDTLTRIRAAQSVFADTLLQLRAKTTDTNGISLRKNDLLAYAFPEVMLWELVKEYGFNFDQCKDMIKEHLPGKIFLSITHRVVIDREAMLVEKITNASPFHVEVIGLESQIQSPCGTLFLQQCNVNDLVIPKESDVATLDLDKITFPLTWRTWASGDRFSPFGMRGSKKVSDLLIDLKIPLSEKENISVLECLGNIVWVVGHRISNDYKVTTETRRVLIIRYHPLSSEIVF